MKRISIKDSFSFDDRLRLDICDPMRKFLKRKGYDLQFQPDKFQMSEEDFNKVGLFPEALSGACKCIRVADGWVLEALCGSVEEIMAVMWTITFRDYLDLLAGKFNPFEDLESFYLLCEIGKIPLPPVKKTDLEDKMMQAVERQAFPELPYSVRLWFDQYKLNAAAHRDRIEALSTIYLDKLREVKNKMQKSRDAGYEGDEHWEMLFKEEAMVLHYWKENLELLC